MANAARGNSILWIVGLSENRHQVIELTGDVDPNTWWMQMRAEFAHDVAPNLTVLRVTTDHGPVFALQFETEQAPYLVKVPKTGWTTSALPWRDGTGLRTATRAELLSILAPSAAVPGLDLIQANATLYETREAAPKLPMAVLTVDGKILIDTVPGQHILFPKHRHNIAVVAPTGEQFEMTDGHITFSTTADDRQPLPGTLAFTKRRLKAISPYGASEQPAGLVVLAPDVVSWKARLGISSASAIPLREASWVDVTLTLPISSTQQAAVLRFRLTKDTKTDAKPKENLDHLNSWVLRTMPKNSSSIS